MNQFFIVGSYRSGTTLLRLILNENSEISCPPETACLVRLLIKHQDFIFDINSKKIANIIGEFENEFIAQGWKSFPGVETVKDNLYGSINCASIYSAIMQAYAFESKKSNTLWVGDNTPVYALDWQLINDYFPNSKFIFLIRDPRDVIASVYKSPFKSCFNYKSCSLEWQERMLQGILAEQALGKGRVLTIRYEDLVSHPDREVKLICGYLGVEYDGNMLDFFNKNAAQNISSQGHHLNAKNPISTSSIGGYKNKLSNKDILRIDNELRSLMTIFGYKVDSKYTPRLKNITKYKLYSINFIYLAIFRLKRKVGDICLAVFNKFF
jgi:protein-tyrosine sulfotransferase